MVFLRRAARSKLMRTSSVLALAMLAALVSTRTHAEQLEAQVLVDAFAEICIPERLSYEGTLTLTRELGWEPVVPGLNGSFDSFIEHADALLAEEFADDPELFDAADGAWFTREIDGRPHLLAISLLLTKFMDTLGCYVYDFGAQAPLDPEPVTQLLDQPIAYSTNGDDPFYAVDPAIIVSTVWGPSPKLPRTGDTYLTFIPQDSPVSSQTGFAGALLKFSTSLPDREALRK